MKHLQTLKKAAVLSAFLLAAVPFASGAGKPGWEYKVITHGTWGNAADLRLKLEQKLIAAGAEGWELVSVTVYGESFFLYLKRRK
jgi:hypothetical protein